jgi:septal ring factor EnvC (AmiA/AmiB activator)
MEQVKQITNELSELTKAFQETSTYLIRAGMTIANLEKKIQRLQGEKHKLQIELDNFAIRELK